MNDTHIADGITPIEVVYRSQSGVTTYVLIGLIVFITIIVLFFVYSNSQNQQVVTGSTGTAPVMAVQIAVPKGYTELQDGVALSTTAQSASSAVVDTSQNQVLAKLFQDPGDAAFIANSFGTATVTNADGTVSAVTQGVSTGDSVLNTVAVTPVVTGGTAATVVVPVDNTTVTAAASTS